MQNQYFLYPFLYIVTWRKSRRIFSWSFFYKRPRSCFTRWYKEISKKLSCLASISYRTVFEVCFSSWSQYAL